MRRSPLLLVAAVAAASLVPVFGRCGGESAETGDHLGVAGASCLRTPDCQTPLQCFANVCVTPGNADASPGPSDVWSFVDAAPPLVLTDTVDATTSDHADETSRDVPPRRETITDPLADAYVPFDVGPDWAPAAPDAQLEAPDTYDACGGLGISSQWSGGFDGQILFWGVEAPPGFEGRVPDSGTLEVYGDLDFEIRCLEQKLIVIGTLSGFGEAVGETGTHPFEVDLRGEYNPLDDTITARLDGFVRLYFVFQVFFEGQLDGALRGGERFDGGWSGAATGNNLNLAGEARGGGEWWATER